MKEKSSGNHLKEVIKVNIYKKRDTLTLWASCCDALRREGISFSMFLLPQAQNLNIIIRNHQTKPYDGYSAIELTCPLQK
jgi:hypothetical protein